MCGFQERAEVTQCCKCQGTDKRDLCVSGWEKGHKVRSCENDTECGVSEENGEKNCQLVPGSKQCSKFQRELAKNNGAKSFANKFRKRQTGSRPAAINDEGPSHTEIRAMRMVPGCL